MELNDFNTLSFDKMLSAIPLSFSEKSCCKCLSFGKIMYICCGAL